MWDICCEDGDGNGVESDAAGRPLCLIMSSRLSLEKSRCREVEERVLLLSGPVRFRVSTFVQ